MSLRSLLSAPWPAPALATASLIVGMILPAGKPELANALFFVAAVLAFACVPRPAAWRQAFTMPASATLLIALAILLAVFTVTARALWHPLGVFYFAPLLLVGCIIILFRGALPAVSLARITTAAAIGAAIAAAVTIHDRYWLGIYRAGVSVNNPIHFADIALVLGFISLAGLYHARVAVRSVAIAGCGLALVAVVLTVARGALVAIAPMAGVAALAILFSSPLRLRLRLLILAGLVLGTVAIGFVLWKPGVMDVSVGQNFAGMLTGTLDADASIKARILMYHGAYNAFLASPVFGHGIIDFVATAGRYAPPGEPFPTYDHLHSDIADFAVVGGVFGLLAYALILAAPLLQAFRAPAGANRQVAIYLALVLSTGYLVMGLTNAMFGVLSQTILYAFGCALVARFSLGDDPAAP